MSQKEIYKKKPRVGERRKVRKKRKKNQSMMKCRSQRREKSLEVKNKREKKEGKRCNCDDGVWEGDERGVRGFKSEQVQHSHVPFNQICIC